MPEKPLRQQLQELANENAIRAARAGFAEIDRHAARAKKKLKDTGIDGADELVDSLGTFLKKTAVQLMTGRPQQ